MRPTVKESWRYEMGWWNNSTLAPLCLCLRYDDIALRMRRVAVGETAADFVFECVPTNNGFECVFGWV